MKIPLAWVVWASAVGLALALLWLMLLWRPARQVESHTRDLLARASARDWPAVAEMMAADYRDEWGQTREGAVDAARMRFSNFFLLQIRPRGPWKIAVGAEGAEASAAIGVFGTGTAVAEMVMEEVRTVNEPTVFRWRKSGRWPWDWELSGAGNEVLAGRYPR
ncbi:MAG: hypothetical protein ACOYOL_10350 [Chthoniobacterales bacterium]